MSWRTSKLAVLTIAVLLVAFSTASAHVRKGTWELQGTVAFSSSSGDIYGNDDLTVFSIAPAVHYFVINKLAIGGKLDVLSSKQGDFSRTSLFIGPSLQYYLAGNMDAQVNPYLGAAVLLRSESFDDGNPLTNEEDQSGSAIQLSAGLAWFLREHLALTPELSVNLESLEGKTGTTIMLGAGLAGFLY